MAGAERAEARRSADAKFNEVLQAANKMVQDGVLVDEKLLALKRTELDALFKKGASRSACVRAALLFWIVQHNNHLYRDADGVGGTAGGGKAENKKKALVQRATVEETAAGTRSTSSARTSSAAPSRFSRLVVRLTIAWVPCASRASSTPSSPWMET